MQKGHSSHHWPDRNAHWKGPPLLSKIPEKPTTEPATATAKQESYSPRCWLERNTCWQRPTQPTNPVYLLRKLQNSKITYHVTGWRETLVDKGFHCHPLDGAVLIVSHTVVVPREQVTGQWVVCDLHLQTLVHPVSITSVLVNFQLNGQSAVKVISGWNKIHWITSLSHCS